MRFDDLCPTANWDVWNRVEDLLASLNVFPLIAVVPDNRDPILNVAAPDTFFWDRVRRWQARGWSVGMHGHHHVYRTTNAGLLGINARSEFAGRPLHEQRAELEAALAVFARERVRPEAWVAPAHSFDRATLRALRELRLDVISDGFFPSPHTDRDGMLWIPQQLWSLRRQPGGWWTVCYHVNRWTARDLRRLEQDLDRFRAQIVDLATMVAIGRRRRRSIRDTVFHRYWRTSLTMRAWLGSVRASLRLRLAEWQRR